MTKELLAIISILGIAFVVVLSWGIINANELISTKESLSATQAQLITTTSELDEAYATLTRTTDQLNSTQARLTTAEGDLVETQSVLDSTQSELSTTQGELTNVENQLADTQGELADTQDDLDDAERKLLLSERKVANLQTTLLSTQTQLTTAQETLNGLGISLYASADCSDVELVDNPSSTNPTWAQLTTFLYGDQTEQHAYILDEYDCSQFSRDLHNRAETAGLRAAEVQIDFENNWAGHALNAFLTTDQGLVFVDCTEAPETIAHIKSGTTYRAVALGNIAPIYFRDENWWGTLSSYYYIATSNGSEAITGNIWIYW